ncbi:hypothetical protein C1H46_015509 [Malus baccata]|uniref:Uncharacterized protein n=1 Tax=Malus baccata TaxID=106549 RepID=A0A540MJ93_MALBA|nr:hypothetical protein C1H46_015509 [Malus baccata]
MAEITGGNSIDVHADLAGFYRPANLEKDGNAKQQVKTAMRDRKKPRFQNTQKVRMARAKRNREEVELKGPSMMDAWARRETSSIRYDGIEPHRQRMINAWQS